jgi:hypothetical protein
MSPHNPPPRSAGESVRQLLRDLPQLRRGSAGLAREQPQRLATGIPQLDALLTGGFPPGRLSEIAGPHSSGRTSVALGLITHATRRGELVAWVDAAQALDPASALAAGATLPRLLWVRPSEPRVAVRCCQCLLEAHGFALIVLDRVSGDPSSRTLPASTWQRLARVAAGTGTALVVLSQERVTGSYADLALSMQPTRVHFSGAPALLEGLEIEAVVDRHRSGPVQRAAGVRLSADPRAA